MLCCRLDRSPDRPQFKNREAPAVKREAEEDWGRARKDDSMSTIALESKGVGRRSGLPRRRFPLYGPDCRTKLLG